MRPAPHPVDDRLQRVRLTADHRFDTAITPVAHPTGDAKLGRLYAHRVAIANALYATGDLDLFGLRHVSEKRYFTRMPGCAPTSGESRNRPGDLPSASLAASTMPSDMPNFILRGARLATITVCRPINVAGS